MHYGVFWCIKLYSKSHIQSGRVADEFEFVSKSVALYYEARIRVADALLKGAKARVKQYVSLVRKQKNC